MELSVSDYKFIKKLVSDYQRKLITFTTSMREDLKNKKTTITVEDLDKFEKAIEGIYEAGYFGDRLEGSIRHAQASDE